ncbi:hypothetical protein J6W91_00580 [Candidatus Saccharibacteria bacterium]|nr:hypothetical protein [Candidatus Saccharibacteria bacterium]
MQPNQNINQTPAAMVNPMNNQNYVFKFLSYYFDKTSLTGTFVYQGIDNTIFTEKVTFAPHPEAHKGKKFNVLDDPTLNQTLDNAMFLAFVLIGTSYYKAHPTPFVHLPKPIDGFQADFFNKVFQEGLSQYAFENGLTRNNLAHFKATTTKVEQAARQYRGDGILSLQSGGKDSLLVATLMLEANIDFTPWYVSSDKEGSHPAVIDEIFPQLVNKGANVAIREIDQLHLAETKGLNGHVPVTYINEALAIVQAILNNQDTVIVSVGNEGGEPHSYIGDLPVNHQWSKTWEAEQLMAEYVKRYISSDIKVGSPIRKYSELRIAELFVNKCWQKYGYKFSSCNAANYKQGNQNASLAWCGECAKCANTYLLFCPFLAPQVLQSLFQDIDLFRKPSLEMIFKGLLGVDGTLKPFECIGSVDELRFAYMHKMVVPPIRVSSNRSMEHNYQAETWNQNLVQASARLGVNKMFNNGNANAAPKEYNPNGNNGQYGEAYSNAKAAEIKELPMIEQKYDKNGKPLPLDLPDGWYQPAYANLTFDVPVANFDYAAEHESQDYFKNFFEDHRNVESPASLSEDEEKSEENAE